MRKRRYGNIQMSMDIFESEEIESWWWQLRFIPTRAEFDYASRKFGFIGYSPLFDEVNPGDRYPSYDVIVEQHAKSNFKVRVQRRP